MLLWDTSKTTLPSRSLQSSIVVNQYIKSLPLAGYEQDGMTEDTKGTLTHDQELECSSVLEQMLKGPGFQDNAPKLLRRNLKEKIHQEWSSKISPWTDG